MAFVWIFLYFGVKGSLNFFSLHVVSELGWTSGMVSIALITQTLAGMIIIGLNGKLIDKVGRRKGATIIIVVGSFAAAALFLLKDFYAIVFMGILSAGFTNSFLMVASTITNELFPTEVRANAMAWSNNIIGRLGQVAVPSVVGFLSVYLSLHYAVAFAVMLPLIGLILILTFIPETKGKKQE